MHRRAENMTDTEKLAQIKLILGESGSLPSDTTLNGYIGLAKQEILNWMYSQIGGVPTEVTNVPTKYEVTQIYAVVAGYTHAGAEGEKQHNENGINRVFSTNDMLDYIRQNVYPIVRIGAVVTT